MPRPRTPSLAGLRLRAHAPRHALEQMDRRLSDHAIRWIAAGVAGVALLGAGAASQPVDAQTARLQPTAVRVTTEFAPRPVTLPAVPASSAARPAAKVAKTAAPTAHRTATKRQPTAQRWLPSGTGMWLHDFRRTEGGNGRQIVAVARRTGLSTLYVQTGSSKKGWIGTPALASLLKETNGTGIKVVAWDFPKLQNPVADARRMAGAAKFRCHGCARVAAVAPDIETAAEGTNIGGRQVQLYYRTLRRLLPRDVAILATVPWPSEMRVGSYPYGATAPLVDAWMPMDYWYNRHPATVTRTSMKILARYRLPIMPVGQGYDARLDAPYLPADLHPGASVNSFLTAAKENGAKAVSLWSWQTTGRQQWTALARAHAMFPVHK